MKNRKLNVSKNSNKLFILSALIIVVGLAMLLIRGLNFGIDFVGGTVIHMELNTTFESSEIREITDIYDTTCEITSAGTDKTQVIISSKIDFTNEQKVAIFSDFEKAYDLTDDDLLSFDKVSPTIGADLRQQAFTASLVAVIGILIYITIRFEFLFGFTAVIALIHDLIVVIGFYAIFQIPVNSSFIVAVLTILGYSINDTIVVFDRIRDNRRKYKKYDFANLLDNSIGQTFKRSIYTSLTTLLAIGALYVFGVESIKEFVLPMMVGFISGTYSSIFVASSLWYKIKLAQTKNLKTKTV